MSNKTQQATKYRKRGSIPHVQQTEKMDELHPLNDAAATHHQVQGATHYLPTKDMHFSFKTVKATSQRN